MKHEVSEHLARVFLETKRPAKKEKDWFPWIVTGCALVLVLLGGVGVMRSKSSASNAASPQSLVVSSANGAFTLSFDVPTPSGKVETLSIDLGGKDLSEYGQVRFAASLNGADLKRLGALKVTLTNHRNEISSVYVRDISTHWKRFTIPTGDFKSVRDRSRVRQLSFTLEPWNANVARGELLIDDVVFVKGRSTTN
jgi:hypothetical protein